MNILITNPIWPEAIEALRRKNDVVCAFKATADDLVHLIRDREVLVFRSGISVSPGLLESAGRLQLIVRAGSGFDNIDLEDVGRRGIAFERIPGPAAKAVSEMSFALMLALARNVLAADSSMRRGRWAKSEFYGVLLTGKVLGIVGAGNIGSRTGRLGAAWGMKVVGCVDAPTPEIAAQLAEQEIELKDLDSVLSESDFLSIHVPLNDSTRHMISERELALMKPGSFLVNLARGGVVDEDALLRALTAERGLRGAALDVHQVEKEGNVPALAALPNVILTPHIGAQTVDSQKEIGQRVLEIVDGFAARHAGLRRREKAGTAL